MDANNELLQAIGQMMDSKLAAALEPINTRLDTIEGKQDALIRDMAHHNHYVEPLLQAVKDGVNGILEHNRQLEQLESKVDDHDDRIWALEQARKAQ